MEGAVRAPSGADPRSGLLRQGHAEYIRSDMEGTILSVNPGAARILKYDDPANLIGKDIARDVLAHLQQRDILREALNRDGKAKNLPLEFRWRDGAVISTEGNAHMLPMNCARSTPSSASRG